MMIKHLQNSLRAVFLSLAVLLSLPMIAVEVVIDGINYNLIPKGKVATVIPKNNGNYSGNIIIPESVEHEGVTCDVTSIGERAFYNCSELTSVTIPNSVISIREWAFYKCSGLTSVTIPNSVTDIHSYAFDFCSGLKSVTIPNSVTYIGSGAFSYCSGLESVTIPNSVTYIRSDVFRHCTGLITVTIPNSVRKIGSYAFSDCSGLTSVTIPNSVTSIEEKAFYNCSKLTSVHISDIVAWCNIEFDSSSTSSNPLYCAGHLFLNSEEIKDLVIPNGVTSIRDITFYGCKGLTSVTIPNSVTSIGDITFYGCEGLNSVTIPNSVTSIGNQAFCNCFGLKSVHISDIAAWCNIEFGDSYSNPLYCAHHLYLNGEEVKDLTIPNSVTSIGTHAFYGCFGLTSVTIPNSVTDIGNNAFGNCLGLTTVTIPNSVRNIGSDAFSCSGLTSVTIPNSVTYIGSGAFSYCSGLTSVTIPNSVTYIGNGAFSYCSGLTSVTIPNSVTSIQGYAFSNCSGLTSVTIPNSVTSIQGYAFSNCPELHDVYCYAEKVPSTNSDAFSGSYIKYTNLYVPTASIESYKKIAPWKVFGKIIGRSKCATPVVTYADGSLEISCETDSAEFTTNIVAEDAKQYNEAKIDFSATYNIEVFATKNGYENSDIVSVALVWVENGDVSEETGVVNVEATPILIQSNASVLSISGVTKNTEIIVYTISGTEIARATSTEGTTTINTGLQSGSIAIVKFGNKSVKIKI